MIKDTFYRIWDNTKGEFVTSNSSDIWHSLAKVKSYVKRLKNPKATHRHGNWTKMYERDYFVLKYDASEDGYIYRDGDLIPMTDMAKALYMARGSD